MYAGLLGRADRVVLLTAAALLQLVFMLTLPGTLGAGDPTPYYQYGFLEITGSISLSAFELVMLWFAVVGNITAVQRAVTIWNRLKE